MYAARKICNLQNIDLYKKEAKLHGRRYYYDIFVTEMMSIY